MIKEQENIENKKPRIQELYRKVCKENTRNYGQGHIDKINIDDNNYKLLRSVIFLYRYIIIFSCILLILFMKVAYKRMIYTCIGDGFIIQILINCKY